MVKRYPDYDLSSRNTFRMRVRCALYVELTEEADLEALDWNALPQPVMVMGGGSNLLFTKDFPGTVLHVSLCHSERSEESWTLGAGVVFDDFCAWAAEEGLWGPENLSLIPGEVGASAVQNIGAYGVEAKDIIAEIRAWDRLEGRFVTIDPADCAYGYRTSKFKTEWKGRYIITAVTYRLSYIPQPRLDYGGVRKALEARGVAVGSPGDSVRFAHSGPSHCPARPQSERPASGPLPLYLSGGGQAPGNPTATPLASNAFRTPP